MIDAILRGTANEGASGQRARVALRTPWCWPVDGELERAALALGLEKPPAPSIGQVLLVSVGDGFEQTVLWRLDRVRGEPREVNFVGKAEESCNLARRLITRDLPFVHDTDPLHRPTTWGATPVWVESSKGRSLPRALDGTSFGLSMCLAYASLVLGLPVPPDMVASAEVDASGAVTGVGGLKAKIGAIAHGALGIRRLLVAKAQEAQATALVAEQGRASLAVTAVRTVADAIRLAFPHWQEAMAERWSDPSFAYRSAEVLYRLALGSDPVLLSWQVVEETSRALEARLASDGTERGRVARERAALALRIAARHEGKTARIEWPREADLEHLPRTVRLTVLSHVVQSAADLDDELARTYAERALPLAGPMGDRDAGAARLLGSVGRAMASCGDYRPARDVLAEAIETWIALFEEDRMSHALSEWLRVTGILGELEALRTARAGWFARFHEHNRTDDTSRAFVMQSLGRALVQAGEPEAGCEVLRAGSHWPLTPEHLQDARNRWLARAMRECGDDAGANGLVDSMRESDQRWLAELDRALKAGDDASAALEGLRNSSDGASECARLLARADGNPAEFVAKHYRY